MGIFDRLFCDLREDWWSISVRVTTWICFFCVALEASPDWTSPRAQANLLWWRADCCGSVEKVIVRLYLCSSRRRSRSWISDQLASSGEPSSRQLGVDGHACIFSRQQTPCEATRCSCHFARGILASDRRNMLFWRCISYSSHAGCVTCMRGKQRDDLLILRCVRPCTADLS